MQNEIYHCGPIACGIDAIPLPNWESGITSTAGSGTAHVISIVGSRPTRPERNPLRPPQSSELTLTRRVKRPQLSRRQTMPKELWQFARSTRAVKPKVCHRRKNRVHLPRERVSRATIPSRVQFLEMTICTPTVTVVVRFPMMRSCEQIHEHDCVVLG